MKNIRTNRRKANNRKNLRNLIAGFTAVAVVMGSTMFAVPAIAEVPTYCGKEVHVHDASCKGCGITENKTQICFVEEHVHGDACYTLVCGDTAHTHGTDCVMDKQTCVEHTHGDGSCVTVCTLIGTEGHVCPEGCVMSACSKAEHTHCVEGCVNTDAEHDHEANAADCVMGCVAGHENHCTFECSLTPHTHTYATEENPENGCYHLTCGKKAHTHTYAGNCWTANVITEAVVDPETSEVITPAVLGHIHGDGTCETDDIICGKEAHEHEPKCYLNAEDLAEVTALEATIAGLARADEGNITGARFIYNEMTAEQKAAVANIGRLAALEIDMDVTALPADADTATGAELVKAFGSKAALALLAEADKADVAEAVATKLAAANTAGHSYETIFTKVQNAVALIRSTDASVTTEAKANAYFALTSAEQTLLDALDANAYTDLQAMLAAGINRVRATEVPGATVKVFNYTDSVNSEGMGLQGYTFFHGTYGPYAKEGNPDNVAHFDKRGSVDGAGTGATLTTSKTGADKLVMKETLVDGYPYIDNGTKAGSLAYLFNGSNGRLKGTMANGGGLFQLQNGYYTYNSKNNAAYFNGSNFELYNIAVVPFYNDTTTSGHGGNFLPFNKIKDASGTYVELRTVTPAAGEAKYRLLESNPTDNWFGLTVDFEFLMPKDGNWNNAPMEFNFSGDDDVWVYIDDVLVMDISGTHGVTAGSINFATGAVTDKFADASAGKTIKSAFEAAGKSTADFDGNTFSDYTKHTFKFFYMERGGNISNCMISFNMPVLPANSLTVGKEVTVTGDAANAVTANGSAIVEGLKDTVEYTFRIVDAEGNPLVTNKTIGLIDRNGILDEDGLRVGADGTFRLKDGEYARFNDMVALLGGIDATYYVEELIPDDLNDQYASVDFVVDGTDGVVRVQPEEGPALVTEEFTRYKPANALAAANVQLVNFHNNIDTTMLNTLKISKSVTGDSLLKDDYQVQVKLNGTVLPTTATYYYEDAPEVKLPVDADGIVKVKAGKTAVIEGIPSGATYEIAEVEDNYVPTFTASAVYNAPAATPLDGDASAAPAAPVQPVVADGKVTGTFEIDTTVSVAIENESKEAEVPFAITKVANEVEAGTSYNFLFNVVEVVDGAEVPVANMKLADGTKANPVEIQIDGPAAKIEPGCTCKDPEPVEGEDGTVITPEAPEKVNGHYPDCAKANFTQTEPGTVTNTAALKFVFTAADDNVEGEGGQTHVYRVREMIPGVDANTPDHRDKFEYDTAVYEITITYDKEAKGARAKVESVTVDGVALEGTIMNLAFENNRGQNITVTKTWDSTVAEANRVPVTIGLKDADGNLHPETKVLDDTNGWTATWNGLGQGERWFAVELDVPVGMNAAYYNLGTTNQNVTNYVPSTGGGGGGGTTEEEEGIVLGAEDILDEDVPLAAPEEEGMVLGAEDEEGMVAGIADTGDSKAIIFASAGMLAALAGIFALRKKRED